MSARIDHHVAFAALLFLPLPFDVLYLKVVSVLRIPLQCPRADLIGFSRSTERGQA
jgi:hypothetical protein